MSKSCQIQGNKYFAPNGAESILYKDLESKLGSVQASDLFVLAYTDSFYLNYTLPILKNYKGFVNSKLNQLGVSSELKYKIKKVNNFETIQLFDGKKMLGYIRLRDTKEGLKVERSLLSAGVEKGKGYGTALYKGAIQYAFQNNKNLLSDDTRTEDAQRVWDKLVKLGIVSQEGNLFSVNYQPKNFFDKNGEPKANKVIEFARELNEESEPLSFAEQQEVKMMMTEFPFVETSVDLLGYLERAFHRDGLFNPTIKSLTDRLYSKYEAENLLSDVNLLAKVKTAIEKLKRTETIENLVVVESKIKTNEMNSFGKFKLANPYKVRQDLVEELGGTQNPDLSEVVDKEVTEEFLAEFKRVPVIDEDGNPVLNKVVYENASKVVDSADVFEALTEEELKEKLLDYGIKLEQVDPFTLKNFLENPSVENTLALNRNAPQREKVIKIANQERDLVFLETNKTEEQLFEELNLLQTETENVYHKIERVDFEEMKQALDLDKNISELQAYKDYFGYKESPTKKENLYQSAIIETDIDYLKDEFVADFNAEILKNPNHEFYNKFEVNEKGISLKYNDPISIAQIQAYLQDDVKLGKELTDYSVISKNMPNLKEDVSYEDRLLEAVNNRNLLKKPKIVSPVDRNTILVENETNEFLNYNGKVFQLKNKEGNSSVYMKISTENDLNYYQTEVFTQDYLDQVKVAEQKLDKYNNTKKLFKEKDLGDNFSCE